MYQFVVRIQDIQEHFDASGVQTYIINSARVVFLRDRKHASPVKVCLACHTRFQYYYLVRVLSVHFSIAFHTNGFARYLQPDSLFFLIFLVITDFCQIICQLVHIYQLTDVCPDRMHLWRDA